MSAAVTNSVSASGLQLGAAVDVLNSPSSNPLLGEQVVS